MKDSKMPTFLFQQNYFRFKTAELLGMARGVASGMKYLAHIGYIHRVIKTLLVISVSVVSQIPGTGICRICNIRD